MSFLLPSGGAQHEVDVNFVIGKYDPAILVAVENPRLEKRLDIAMNGLHVAIDAPGEFADRDRAGAGQSTQDLPAFGRDHLPQQLRRGETDEGPLLLALKGAEHSRLRALCRGNA